MLHLSKIKPHNWDNLPFAGKIRYYGLNLDKRFAKYVDKLEAKKTIKEICGDKIKVAAVRKILNSFDDIKPDDVRPPCIIKTTHASQYNILILDSNVDINKIKKQLFYFKNPYRPQQEKQYSFVCPRFFVEELIDDKIRGKTNGAYSYMVYCMFGKPFAIVVYIKDKINHYDTKWQHVEPPELGEIEKPQKFDLLLELATLASQPFEFVRVDFFIDTNDDIYFGEFTFTPSGGHMLFSKELEMQYGKLWKK